MHKYWLRLSFSSVTLLVTGLLALHLLGGCERAPAGPPVETFVGFVEGTDAFVGITRVDGGVVAYVCDGRGTAVWLSGDAVGDRFALASGGRRLEASAIDGVLRGTFVTERGTRHVFRAEPAVAGSGLYRATQTIAGIAYVGGWVLLSDGRQRGALKQDGTILTDWPTRLDTARPVVTLPGGGVLEARPAGESLTSWAL